ncbi:MAG: hypothetical protein JO288_21435 [Hyphomicrobiales bacterium]|nr:hypothetical protein [Hyphomicrobiales bacterium]
MAGHRNPESYVAGASVINREGPRYSADIDIFHDREESVAKAADADAALLTENGFALQWLRREPGIHVAVVGKSGDDTRLEWARDSDFRFFPAVSDPLFGYRLHLFDLATNKALAAAGRREPRDVLDLITLHERHIRLGAAIWAAVGKDPGYSPASLIAEIRRNARYRADDYADLATSEPIDAGAVARRFREILDEAEAFVRAMPAEQAGLAYLKEGQPVEPEPSRLDAYAILAGSRRGHWPSSPQIASAMIERKPRQP